MSPVWRCRCTRRARLLCVTRAGAAEKAGTVEALGDGVDSLRLLETVASAEEHFSVQVDTGGLDALATVGDIVRLMRYSGGQGEFP